MEKQVNQSNYDFKKYVKKGRWSSYWHQIDEVLSLAPSRLLIIGDGDGITRKVLSCDTMVIKTLDIDEEMRPDYVGSVTELSTICDTQFDAVLCCQVLEHIPFSQFESCLQQISMVSRTLILSLPQKYYNFQIGLFLWTYGRQLRYVSQRKNVSHSFDGQHYWEIGTKNSSLNDIKSVISKYFVITKDYTATDPYHHFFILDSIK